MNQQYNNSNQQKKADSLSTLTKENATKSNAIEIPQITLPKGGGAIKGIDEKFQVNAANGTASFSIPLPFSPNRNGFTPQLSLSYNSGTGNSLFGIGWDLGLPAIQRSTNKQLPRYFDTNNIDNISQEDSFMFSGAEELVPHLDFVNDNWAVKQTEDPNIIIRTYRPRIEGSFSRIERIYNKEEKFYYWRITSKENITTFFGYTAGCRIANPTDDKKVYQWLPEFSYDDKGSWVWYHYKEENLDTVANEVHEKNRFDGIGLFSNKHIKYIKYGNAIAKYFEESPYIPLLPQNENHFFTLVFDYGEHNKEVPETTDSGLWAARYDAFSSCRSGFEMRTYRLCQRVLMFHNFNELDGETLVRSTDFEYKYSNFYGEDKTPQEAELVYVTGITQKGYIKTGTTYSAKALPKMSFDYQWLQWNKEVKEITTENLVHAPVGISGNYQWTDFHNEGINGILTEQAHAWYYKSNLGNGTFTQAQLIMPKPSLTGLHNGSLQLQDLEANGEKQLVVNTDGLEGYFELNDNGEWQPFKAFVKNLNVNLSNPNMRMIDVNGDGKPEVLLTDQAAFWYWPNNGKMGYDSVEIVPKPFDEDKGPAIVFQDMEQRIFLADMTGDGLTDIVRIRNGEICYWQNMGYGIFSAKVTMRNAPVFDYQDLFNPKYIQLADISGTGATDIVYLGQNKFNAYLNCCGNSWSKAETIDPFFPTEQPNNITVTDLLGNGTACIVWSSEQPAYQQAPMRYIDLMGGIKPHIMRSHENGMGKKTEVEYKSSTHYYLEDKKKGTPWITKLAFPVQVVSKTIITESVTNVRFTAQYNYRHGYYDHAEREFRGFGCVEQLDTEAFDVFKTTEAGNVVEKMHHQPPVLTKTWFHNGYFISKDNILNQFKNEYWEKGTKEFTLPNAIILAADSLAGFNINLLTAEEWREALRACRGMTLRQEIFAVNDYISFATGIEEATATSTNINYFDVFKQVAKQEDLVPYSVATHNCEIQLLQQRAQNKYAVFIVKESEAITHSYERNANDPRVAHSIILETDELGNVLQTVSIVYPRQTIEPLLADATSDTQVTLNAKKHGRDGQQKMWITYTENNFTNDIIDPANYYLRKGWQTKTYELTGILPVENKFTIPELKTVLTTIAEIEYQQQATNTTPEKRLIEHIKTKFYNELLSAPLADGQMAIRAIAYEAYQLAYTPNLLNDIFVPTAASVNFAVTNANMQAGKFLQDNNNWWIQSGTVLHFRTGENMDALKNRFFAPVGYIDPFDSKSEVFYDARHLFMERSIDALGNENKVVQFDYRTLSPVKMFDLNNNLSSVVVDELGLVKAVAAEGKDTNADGIGDEGDNVTGMNSFTNAAEQLLIQEFFTIANTTAPAVCNYTNLQSIARQLLGNASARMVYDFTKQPTVVASIAREQHKSPETPLQISFEYTDGLGKVAMKKVQAEPGNVILPDSTELDTGSQLRWIGNGRTVLNNKGNPIKQYEPYFSTTPAYENDPTWVERGISPTIYYDGAGRNIKTELPNGTFTKVAFDAWKQITYDVNDTVMDSDWYNERITLPNNNPERKAADKTALHHNTPSIIFLDTLGRPTLGIDHNKWEQQISGAMETKEEWYYTFSVLDIEGNALSVTDARGNMVMAWKYDMLGHRVAQTSMDAGKRWMLNNTLGKPVTTWDERGHTFSYEYDELQRPIKTLLLESGSSTPTCIALATYGEAETNAKNNNLKGKPFKQCDGSGQIKTIRYDFKGNALTIEKQLPQDAKASVVDWDTSTTPDATIYTQITEYDALNRMQRLYNWHFTDTNRGTVVAVYEPAYSARGVLEKEDVIVNAQKTSTAYSGGLRQPVVKDIIYDAKGQRMRMRYGNGTTTCYHYDPLTFRLVQLRTTKINNETCTPNIKSNLNDVNTLQNLFYTYDPTGNITEIYDDAYKPVFFNGQKVLPQNTYTYNAQYRLIQATGREQANMGAAQQKNNDWQPNNFPISNSELQGYEQKYIYDSVGNIVTMKHIAAAGSWTRNYQYALNSNHLLATEMGSSITYDIYVNIATLADKYNSDIHGNITQIGNGIDNLMVWNYADIMQQYDLIGGGNAFYQYSGEKQRSRKYIERDNGSVTEERLYLGGLERYRRWRNNNLEEEIETIHIFESTQRILIIENVWQTNNNNLDIGVLHRYQYSNHLGSACLELNNNAAIISYEEYHPYGTTAYCAKNANINATAKRYRYTGMERDEESGFAYHTARYYLPWLGRWLSADPIGIGDGVNVYGYCRNNPIMKQDSSGTQSTPENTSPVSITPLITDIAPTGLSGSLQFHNLFSGDRSVSGNLALSGGVRSSFMLNVPSLGLNTTGIADVSGTAAVNTSLGSGGLRLRGGLLLGDLSGLNLAVRGEGTFQIPVPERITLGTLPGSLLTSIPEGEGSVRLSGAFASGSTAIASFNGEASLADGNFSAQLRARTALPVIGDAGRLQLNATGTIGADGTPTLNSVGLNAEASLPGISASVSGTGIRQDDGRFRLLGNAELNVLGGSVHAEGAGTASTNGADFSGTFSGAGPLYTSYLFGNFSLSTETGISANAGVLGLTYSPSVSLSDPSSDIPGFPPATPTTGTGPFTAAEPWSPGGLTIGASLFQYRNGGVNYVSGGFMPDLSLSNPSSIFTNPRVGITAGFSF
jgi:RHS repeat-associated protein